MCVTFSSLLISQDDTEVCKQTFSWLSRYAEMTHRMNPSMYLFYIWDRHNIRETADKLKDVFTYMYNYAASNLLHSYYIVALHVSQYITTLPNPPTDKKTIFFPQFADSSADQVNSSQTPDNTDSCRKYLSSHPSLTPGIFIVYCPHAICYGFEVMRSHEPTQHPFEIFFTCFQQPPTTIL